VAIHSYDSKKARVKIEGREMQEDCMMDLRETEVGC